jgi:hypothetical protein
VNKNISDLKSFEQYCVQNPGERFWQALRNWSGHNFIYVSDRPSIDSGVIDTFYLDKQDKNK